MPDFFPYPVEAWNTAYRAKTVSTINRDFKFVTATGADDRHKVVLGLTADRCFERYK
jgi:hypothetical protein